MMKQFFFLATVDMGTKIVLTPYAFLHSFVNIPSSHTDDKKGRCLHFLITALSVSASFTALAQLKIVCIGNSITQGKTGLKKDSSYEFSYRPWLWKKLVEAGLKVNMVGYHPYFFDEKEGELSMKFEVRGVPFDRDCEAYYGITSSGFVNGSASAGWTGAPLPEFAERINDPKRGYTPHIALIHLGTNDADSTEALVAITRNNLSQIVSVLRNKILM
jgi:hypothetical protein